MPGLNIAQLGGLGQKSSLTYNGYASGEMAFLFDGFEISDPSDPSEGFDVSAYLMSPEIDVTFSSLSSGLSFRQWGGGISIDPKFSEGQLFKSSVGSNGQGLLSYQKSKCHFENCVQVSFGGTYTGGQSASVRTRLQSETLENDASGLYFLTLGWVKPLKTKGFLKIRTHSQYSVTELDDYNQEFVFIDDPNAKMQYFNQFSGVSYLKEKSQLYFENNYSLRQVRNEVDSSSDIVRDDQYELLRTKIRGAHQAGEFEFLWSLQNIDVQTESALDSLSLVNKKSNSQNKSELSFQLDHDHIFKHLSLNQNVSLNVLEGYDSGFGFQQALRFKGLSWNKKSKNSSTLFFYTQYGLKNRRPSFFQLFDPQFGNLNLQNERQLFFRPQADIKWSKITRRLGLLKHNISLLYSLEDLNQRVVFLNSSTRGYTNAGKLNFQALTLEYSLQTPVFSTKAFVRHSLDSEAVTKNLPWTAQQELGLSFGLRHSRFILNSEMKWLFEMYNPSQSKMKPLLQSQATLAYQFDTDYKIGFQLNNFFNNTTAWDEGFFRQPLSWMMTLTKKI